MPRASRTCSSAACRAGASASSGCSAERCSGVDRLEHPLWLRDSVALGVIDAYAGEHLDDLRVLGEFCDGLLAGQMADLVDRAHHLPVDRVVQDLAHEAAVDLEEIDREVLEVTEGRQAGAEIIEREFAPQLLERLDEAVGLRETGDRGGLGDLETDLAGIDPALLELVDDE